MLLSVVTHQGLADLFERCMTVPIAMGGQRIGISLASHDRADDTHPSYASDVRNHMMELEIHLGQRLLHVLNMCGGVVQQALTLAQIGAQRRDVTLGPEAGAQQAIGMQPLEPLRVTDVGFASRNVSGISGVDEKYLEPMLFKDLVDGDPIDAGRFHGDGLNAAWEKAIARYCSAQESVRTRRSPPYRSTSRVR